MNPEGLADRRCGRWAFVNPERWETDYEFVPRVQDGLISGTGENVKVVRVSFTFSEILPK
jgi:hypothetical protein